jgi:hypothetical protein
MARFKPFVNDDMWKKIEPLLPELPPHPKGGAPWTPDRPCLEGILWVLRSGARWQDLPERYPSPSTWWRRLRMWEERDVWLEIWRSFGSNAEAPEEGAEAKEELGDGKDRGHVPGGLISRTSPNYNMTCPTLPPVCVSTVRG